MVCFKLCYHASRDMVSKSAVRLPPCPNVTGMTGSEPPRRPPSSKRSARSGEEMPRFRASSLLSIRVLPAESSDHLTDSNSGREVFVIAVKIEDGFAQQLPELPISLGPQIAEPLGPAARAPATNPRTFRPSSFSRSITPPPTPISSTIAVAPGSSSSSRRHRAAGRHQVGALGLVDNTAKASLGAHDDRRIAAAAGDIDAEGDRIVLSG